MKLIRPFRGLRPPRELAAQVASPPYDVLNREEAHALAKDNPLSFLHINKPEVDLDAAVDVFDARVYQKGAENLQRFIADGVLQQDSQAGFYLYRQVMGEHQQTGLVAVASIDAYEQDLIKKHEYTRPDKEDDRVAHMDALGAQVGPVFLTYRQVQEIDRLIAEAGAADPEYDFVAPDGTRHVFWLIEDGRLTEQIETAFTTVPCLYVADGHHRSAAATRVRQLYRERNPAHRGDESYNYFLVVLFPDHQMQILDYNRVFRDLNGMTSPQFLERCQERFSVVEAASAEAVRPSQPRQFGLYLDGHWYQLVPGDEVLAGIDATDPVQNLDVSIMQNEILTPLLGIEDQRTDSRVDFIGGIRGLEELEKRVDSGQWQAAIALYPTSIQSLMAIADAGQVMPPKTTWFEPKLKSGLVVHLLD